MSRYLSTRNVADILCYKRTSSVVALIECGRLPCARVVIGGRGRRLYRPTVQELAAYLRAHDQAMLPKLVATYPADVSREMST